MILLILDGSSNKSNILMKSIYCASAQRYWGAEAYFAQRLSIVCCKSYPYGAVEVLAECIPSPRFCLSPCTPIRCTRRLSPMIQDSKLSIGGVDSSVAPNSVTAMIAAKMSTIPVDCCIDGDSLSIMTPQMMVSTGCKSTAKEVWAAGSLGRAQVIAIQPIT